MLAKWLRRVFGSVRLFMTMLAVLAGLVVVFLDLRGSLRLTAQLYAFLSAILGAVAVFVWKDTDRPSGYNHKGFRYDNEDGEGNP
jgi:membrane protease YdiL (CAAX protease family)